MNVETCKALVSVVPGLFIASAFLNPRFLRNARNLHWFYRGLLILEAVIAIAPIGFGLWGIGHDGLKGWKAWGAGIGVGVTCLMVLSTTLFTLFGKAFEVDDESPTV